MGIWWICGKLASQGGVMRFLLTAAVFVFAFGCASAETLICRGSSWLNGNRFYSEPTHERVTLTATNDGWLIHLNAAGVGQAPPPKLFGQTYVSGGHMKLAPSGEIQFSASLDRLTGDFSLVSPSERRAIFSGHCQKAEPLL
jgi:hypothetical protein